MTAIYMRELRSYFTGFTGYVFAAFILLFGGIFTMVVNLANAVTNFEYVLGNMTFVFIIAVPVLTMRVFAEEKKQKTDLLLYSLPHRMLSVVMGKYLAMLTVFALPTAVMSTYPMVLSFFGNVNLKSAYSALLGFFLMGSVLIAIGMLISSFTENQAIAAAVCFVVVLINYFLSSLASFVSAKASASLLALFLVLVVLALLVRYMTASTLVAGCVALTGFALLLIGYVVNRSWFEGLFGSVMSSLSVFDRFNLFVNGVLDGSAVIYFLSVIALMIFYTVQSLEKRRWS